MRDLDLDRSIEQALDADDRAFLAGLEPTMAEQLTEPFLGRWGPFRGRWRFLVLVFWLGTVAFVGLGVWSAVRFFAAEETHEQLAWLGGFMLSMLVVGLGKVWFWLELDKGVILREVKRLELQVAALTEAMRKSS